MDPLTKTSMPRIPKTETSPVPSNAVRVRVSLKEKETQELVIGDKTLTLSGKAFEGDLCSFYLGTYSAPKVIKSGVVKPHPSRFDRILEDSGAEDTTRILLKVTNSALDTDLLDNEIKTLDFLSKDEGEILKYLPKSYNLPHLDGIFIGIQQAHILEYCEGYVSLAEVIKAYPKGIDFRDAAWMLRRILEGITYVHDKGVVHGALLPPHILIHPTEHSAKIIDWSYAVQRGKIRALCSDYVKWYPPEVIRSVDATKTIDLYMIAKMAMALLGGDPLSNTMPIEVPSHLQELLLSCVKEDINRRPKEAVGVYKSLSQVLETLVGKPKYRPFSMPKEDTK